MYNEIIPQYIRMLNNVNKYLDKAVQHAETKKYDPNVLLQMRLIPDQWPLVKQIQVATDNAKGTMARLAGKDVPKFEDNEKSIPELRARIEKTVAFLKTLKPTDFNGWEERKIPLFFNPEKWLPGAEYLYEFSIPNFYFHLTTAYSILRSNGVDLGKQDYLGGVNFRG